MAGLARQGYCAETCLSIAEQLTLSNALNENITPRWTWGTYWQEAQ